VFFATIADMNTFENSSLPQENPMAEIQSILGTMHASGAMDEEGPFVDDLMRRITNGSLTPENAVILLRKKLRNRQDYH